MDLDDEELKATRKMHGLDKKDIKTSMQQLEIHIANELNDEQWKNWQEVLKYINELQKNKCDHNISNECIRKTKIRDMIKDIDYELEICSERNTRYKFVLLGKRNCLIELLESE